MATEKKITSRIQQKHDVAANWAKATNFIPKKGEIIIYDAEYNASGEETQAVRFKIGDGTKTVVNLPFAVIDGEQKISGVFYFLKAEDGSIVGIGDGGVMVMSQNGNPSSLIVGKTDDTDIYAALLAQSSGDLSSPSLVSIGLGEPTEVQLGGEAGSAKQVFTSQGGGVTPKWTSVVNSLNGNTGDITGIATTSQLDNKQDKITSSNKLSSSLVDGLGTAASKAVDTTITANSTSVNLPTSKAVEDRINAHSGIDKVGTITGVKMNGVSKGTSGVVDLGTVITDVSGKQDKLSTAQINATNSGITSAKVTAYDGYGTSISNLETSLGEAEQDIADNSTAIGKIQGAFESNGTTVKKATSAGTADKVANKLTFQQFGSGVVKELVFDGSKNQAVRFDGGLVSGYDETNAILNVEMEDSGVTSGTYNKVTVNKKGCVTAGENVDYVTTDSEQEISVLKTFTSAQGVGSYQGAFRVFVSKEEMDNYYAKFATGDSTSTDITFTSMTNKAFLARTNNANRTAYKDAGIDVWKPSGKYSFLFPEKSGTLAMTTDVEGKANLTGGNTFKGEQSVTRDDAGSLLSVTNTAGDTFFQIHQGANGEEGNIFIGTDTAQAPISLDGSFGLEGQVFTSRGSEHTPQWTNLTYDSLSRIKKQGYAGDNNAVQYFKLATFPEYNSSGNYASFIVTGRMGGWEAGNMSFVNMILYNRGAEGGGYINVDNSSFYNLCDVVMYRETSGASTAYLKVKGYYTFDINVNSFQATSAYTGAAVTPTGTLKWTASTQADRLAVSDGVAYVNGFTLPKQVQINGTTVNPNSAGLINLGSDFATTDKLPTFSLSGTTLTITL